MPLPIQRLERLEQLSTLISQLLQELSTLTKALNSYNTTKFLNKKLLYKPSLFMLQYIDIIKCTELRGETFGY